MKPSIQSIQDAFFAAMAAGYAQSVEKVKIKEIPGAKAIPFVWGDFQVLDTWVTTPLSDNSGGITLISHNNAPVWMMHYGGWYVDFAIPFLKSCLHRAYVEERNFFGGRGPSFVRGDRFTYVNRYQGNFNYFTGEELIFDLDDSQVGWHWYRGQSLLEDYSQ